MEKGIIIKSLTYKFIERFLVKGLGLVISVILARLLSPTEFGQIAIIMVFINLSIVFVDSGLNTALVQSKNIVKEDYSTVFYVSFVVSVILIILLHLFSPYIASFYAEPNLEKYLKIYSFSLIFSAINSILYAKMQREMMFKQMMWCNIISSLISGSIGIIMAYYGLGVWALISYYFSYSIITSISMLCVTGWILSSSFSIARAKRLFDYGWKMLMSSILCSVYNDVRTLIIGKRFSPSDLGYYNRAQQFPEIIAQTMDNVVQSVMFPVISQHQDDRVIVISMLRKTIKMGAFMVMPMMLGLMAVADSLIEILLTDKWLPSASYMKLICLGNSALLLTSSNLVAIKALGRSDVYLKLEVIRRLMMVVVLLISVVLFDSVYAISVGYAISCWLDFILVAGCNGKMMNYGIINQISDIWKIVIASILMFCIVSLMNSLGICLGLKTFLQVAVGSCIYIVICKVLNIDTVGYLSILFGAKNRE